MSHSLARTSRPGTPFIGTCIKCGRPGLTIAEAMEGECDNPSRMSDNEVLLKAIEGPET